MKRFQSKPQISENSKIIAKVSKRALENAQVFEMLTSPEAKKVAYLIFVSLSIIGQSLGKYFKYLTKSFSK